MKIVSIVTLFATCMCQLGIVVAQGRVPVASPVSVESGKPDHGTSNRELSGWSWTTTYWSTKSSKTSKSTDHPTFYPTLSPSKSPSDSPLSPTKNPSKSPTKNPTASPSFYPTLFPTLYPTLSPTLNPTLYPTTDPTNDPTISPTPIPTESPTYCGKASKSWWHSHWGSRKLGDLSTKSSKSESCHSGSRSWGHRRQAREKRKGNGRYLRQDEADTDEAMFKTDEIKERRRINGGKPTKADDPV